MAGEGPTKRIILLRKNRVGQSIQDQTFRFCYCDGEKEIQAEIMRSCFGQHVIKNTNQITVPPPYIQSMVQQVLKFLLPHESGAVTPPLAC